MRLISAVLSMRWTLALVGLNVLVWCLPVLTGLARFAPIGSYRFWWYDDVPFAALGVAGALGVTAFVLNLNRRPIARGFMTTIAALTFCAFIPWLVMSGGGV